MTSLGSVESARWADWRQIRPYTYKHHANGKPCPTNYSSFDELTVEGVFIRIGLRPRVIHFLGLEERS
jgi:hypothetical protein